MAANSLIPSALESDPATLYCTKLLASDTKELLSCFYHGGDTKNIISCFYCCVKPPFIEWTKIAYKRIRHDLLLFISNNAFTDGILAFSEKAGAGGIYIDKAGIEKIVFGFCRNKLRESIQREERLEMKQRIFNQYTLSTITSETETEDKLLKMEEAFQKLSAEDRQIITWRHLEEKSGKEIAGLLGITVESATNRIYRCMQRLKNLMKNKPCP